jgi:hypothetical protein
MRDLLLAPWQAQHRAMMARTWPMVEALRLRRGFGPGRLTRSAASHSALLRALSARNAVKAASLRDASSRNATAGLLARAIAVGGRDEAGPVSGPAGQRRRSR